MVRDYIKTREELREELFSILCEIDRICKKYDIKYYLAYGTELGAVREQDFIPWDDDIDIKVLREDYEKFAECMKKELSEEFDFVSPEDHNPYFYDFFPRIIKKKKYIERIDEFKDMFYGVDCPQVEVFIADKAPNGKLQQRWTFFLLKVVYVMCMSKRPMIAYSNYKKKQRIGILVLISIGKIFSQEHLVGLFHKIQTRYLGKETQYRMISNFLFRETPVFEENIFSEIRYVSFHGKLFPVPAKFSSELITIYGTDYMIPRQYDDNKEYKVHAKVEE